VNDISWRENQRFEGQSVEVLVSTGEGRKDSFTERLSGRARDNRLVHFTPGPLERFDGHPVRPGDVVTATITYAAPHHLVSDVPITTLRRTRAGDAGQGQGPRPSKGVALGLPSIGVPAPMDAATACQAPAAM
jgi:tRNA-2-methylthio-N6-dimethylallyladenosine synthase